VPSRGDRNGEFNPGMSLIQGIPMELPVLGTPTVRSEAARTVEAGYRVQSGQRWSLDASLFQSTYSRLIANRMSLLPQVIFLGGMPTLQLPSVADNLGAGRTYGGEIWSTWQFRSGWRLMPSYAYTRETKWLPEIPGSAMAWGRPPEDLRHQGRLRLQYDLSRSVQMDGGARFRSRESTFQTPGAILIDARVGYRPTRSGELSVAVWNLTDKRVLETYSEFSFSAIPVRRSFVVKWSQQF